MWWGPSYLINREEICGFTWRIHSSSDSAKKGKDILGSWLGRPGPGGLAVGCGVGVSSSSRSWGWWLLLLVVVEGWPLPILRSGSGGVVVEGRLRPLLRSDKGDLVVEGGLPLHRRVQEGARRVRNRDAFALRRRSSASLPSSLPPLQPPSPLRRR